LQIATGGELNSLIVQGPIGEPVTAIWLTLKKHHIGTENKNDLAAVLELASACGLAYIAPDRLAALDAHTFGVGQLIEHCYQKGFRNIVLAVGGSASTDGGTGILTALGALLLDKDGKPVSPGGRGLHAIHSVDLSALERYHELQIQVATDVTNHLLGENGAANIFGPQKGASAADVKELDAGLLNFANVLERTTGKQARHLNGAGAAGGVPFGLALALNAEIIPGFDWISSLINLEEDVKQSDIVLSAEGCLDSQSVSGKASGQLARMCIQYGKRFRIIAGQIEDGVDWTAHGVEQVIAAAPPGRYASLQDISDATVKICSKV